MKRVVVLLALVACSKPRPLDSLCGPGEVRCATQVLQVCADDGQAWIDQDDCGGRGLVCDSSRAAT